MRNVDHSFHERMQRGFLTTRCVRTRGMDKGEELFVTVGIIFTDFSIFIKLQNLVSENLAKFSEISIKFD